MKGILLSEFVEFLEIAVGEDQTQHIINDSQVKSEGAYSRVGQYDYQELIQLLTQAAKSTKIDQTILLNEFSDHMFAVFKRDYSEFFANTNNAVEMLKQIDGHIHVEVKKLYPDAELPKFSYTEDGDKLTLRYQSSRPFASVAHALLNACINYFDHKTTLLNYDIADNQKSAVFIIEQH